MSVDCWKLWTFELYAQVMLREHGFSRFPFYHSRRLHFLYPWHFKSNGLSLFFFNLTWCTTSIFFTQQSKETAFMFIRVVNSVSTYCVLCAHIRIKGCEKRLYSVHAHTHIIHYRHDICSYFVDILYTYGRKIS
jgi:hypothetical protein